MVRQAPETQMLSPEREDSSDRPSHRNRRRQSPPTLDFSRKSAFGRNDSGKHGQCLVSGIKRILKSSPK